ncbi:MAG: hypothetical protein AB1899_06210 [Pseudomonadota bacterium]
MADKDYPGIIRDLIANAVGSARVAGENSRITRLVAGSLERFAAELRTEQRDDEARQLVSLAADLLAEKDGDEVVPTLTAVVEAMAARN